MRRSRRVSHNSDSRDSTDEDMDGSNEELRSPTSVIDRGKESMSKWAVKPINNPLYEENDGIESGEENEMPGRNSADYSAEPGPQRPSSADFEEVYFRNISKKREKYRDAKSAASSLSGYSGADRGRDNHGADLICMKQLSDNAAVSDSQVFGTSEQPKHSKSKKRKQVDSEIAFESEGKPDRSKNYEYTSRTATPDILSVPEVTTSRDINDVEQAKQMTSPRDRRRRCILYAIPAFLLGVLFLILMPISFVYVDFDKMALLRSRTTGVVDLDVTYYPGCYVLGPDSEFLFFPRTGNLVRWGHLSMFSASRLKINIEVTLLYHIRSEQLGKMFAMYAFDYADIFERIAEATLKNTGAKFTLEEYRLQRPLVEKTLHNATREKLNAHFVKVDFFWLGVVTIPEIIRSGMMASLLHKVQAETALFNQTMAITEIGTTRLTALQRNKADELLKGSQSIGSMIRRSAAAEADKLVQTSEINAWDAMCRKLGFVREDMRMSILYIHHLNKMDNLYWASSEMGTNFSYTYFSGFDRTAYDNFFRRS